MIRAARQGRRDNWPAPLLLRFPMARSAGFECFKGWRPILSRLLERLEAAIEAQPVHGRTGFEIRRIKQKFGTLRVYISGATPEMLDAIDEAEQASAVTCEVCGEPGRLADRNGWTSVKCDQHENWSRLDGVV